MGTLAEGDGAAAEKAGSGFQPPQSGDRPRIVIVGAGFGGLACAQALGGSDVQVTLVDRRNYHLFAPLLYQVATAALSPTDIASPIRSLLRRHANVAVVMGTVSGVDWRGRQVLLEGGESLPYDRLVLSTGAVYSYFGHDDWEAVAPGLKTLDDARTLRARLLGGFEAAELLDDPERQRALTTSVVVGGGPTGVEMAGAIAELRRDALRHEFRRIDPALARVILVEAGPRILSGFPEHLGAFARERLEDLGVEVLTGTAVEEVREDGVAVGGGFIPAGTLVWAAGTRASPVARWLDLEGDRAGRVAVEPDFSVPGRPGVHVIGDAAACRDEAGALLPGLAQVAKQQGHHLGRELARSRGDGPLAPSASTTAATPR